ncbi:MAG: cytochrome c [Deltaproteobacteria bacterium]|nr:cytochrome c [Deltaproteobacteria bacterium]
MLLRKPSKADIVLLAFLAVTAVFVVIAIEPYWTKIIKQQWYVYTDPGRIRLGEKLYLTYCQDCHGHKASGQFPEKPKGGLDELGKQVAPALDGTGHSFHHPLNVWHRQIKKGSRLKNSRMKSWERRMSQYEIESVVAYIQSLWPEELLDQYQKMMVERNILPPQAKR